jgi:hypothetical protein
MAKNKPAPVEQITEEELEAASAAGLSPARKINGRHYELTAVALKENMAKCEQLYDFAQELKAQGIPNKLEEKSACIALYLCAE